MMKTSRFLIPLLIFISACAQQTSTPIILPLDSPTPVPTRTRVPASPTAPSPSPTATSAPTPPPGAPWQQRSAPRTLLDAADITRIKQWTATYAWARGARDQIIQSADAWPSQYLKDFN